MAAATLSTEASAIATEDTTTDTDAAATVPKGGRLEAVAAEEAAERAARRKAAQEAARAANEWHVVSGDDFVEGWGMPNGERDSITARMKRSAVQVLALPPVYVKPKLKVSVGVINACLSAMLLRLW